MKRYTSRRAGAFALVTCALLASCASAGGAGGTGAMRRSSGDRLVASDLEQAGSSDLYSAVQRLRPQWLVVRGGVDLQGQQAAIALFVDGVQQTGGIDVMRNLQVTDIQEVRFLNARDATTKYGTNMTVGAIEVTTKN